MLDPERSEVLHQYISLAAQELIILRKSGATRHRRFVQQTLIGVSLTELLLLMQEGTIPQSPLRIYLGTRDEKIHGNSRNNVEADFVRGPTATLVTRRTNLEMMKAKERIDDSTQAYQLVNDLGAQIVIEIPRMFVYRSFSEIRQIDFLLRDRSLPEDIRNHLVTTRSNLVERILTVWADQDTEVSKEITVKPNMQERLRYGKPKQVVRGLDITLYPQDNTAAMWETALDFHHYPPDLKQRFLGLMERGNQ